MAHGVEGHGRMIPRSASVKLRVAGVAIVRIRIGSRPLILAEMRLRKGDEHSFLIRRLENLREAQMRAGLTAVIMVVNEVDSKTLKPLQTFVRSVQRGPRRPHLGIIQRHGTKEDPAPVQIEIPALNPK